MKYIEFINDEQSYLNWLRVNSEGFVVNTPKSKPLNNRVLHTAACSHVTKLRGNANIGGFTERNYIKICSLSVYQLRDWTKLEGMKSGSFDKECPHCRPWLQHSYTSIEQGLEAALLLKPNYKDLTSRHAVIKAIDEFNSLGRKEFLSKYGFGKARQFFLVYEGEQYDSKAIFGAAYGYQFSRPLQSDEFSGGNDTVRPILEKLKFTIITNSVDDTSEPCSYKPKERCQSIDFEEFWSWLKQKTNYDFSTVKQNVSFTIDIDNKERVNITPLSSKTKRSVGKNFFKIFTEQYNEKRSMSPSDYEGRHNSYLTSLIFAFNSDDNINNDKEVDEPLKKLHKDDVLKTIKIRQGQSEFRRVLLEEFNYRCAITGCLIEKVLEAAHIVPHKEETNYHASNGLILRADIHTLYDLELLKIDEDGKVFIDQELIDDKNYLPLLDGKSINPILLTARRIKLLKQRFSDTPS